MQTHWTTRTLRGGLLPLLCLGASACQTFEEGRGIPATPQRPTFSTDTSTTAAGTLELESGIAFDPGDRLGTPSALKFGLDERSEVFVGFEPWIVLDAPGGDEGGIGDLQLGYRQRFLEGHEGRPALAYLALVKLPTADDDQGLGSGETDLLAALAATWAGSSWSQTAYLQLGLLGDPDGGSLLQSVGSYTLGHPLADDLSAFGELALLLTPEVDDEQLLATLGLAKAWAPGRVVDVGVVLGASEDAPELQFVIGTTMNLGRVASR